MRATRTQLKWLTALAVVAMSAVVPATSATADTWNERTELTFTEAVLIPGATLQPGTYTFRLANTHGSRHLVQIYKGELDEMIALTQAVPVRRLEPTGDTALTFNPSDSGTPALKAWYYPNSSYGHEFIYPEEEARRIAERSKTIVLSADIDGSDLSKGTLRLYHPQGNHTEWRADEDTEREWSAWQRRRVTVDADHEDADSDQKDHDGNGHGDNGEHAKAHAPMMMTEAAGTRVALDDLESNPTKYLEKRVEVDAEVEEVYGPRLFTIDEPHWGDLDGEVLVYAPTALAALVKDDDRVTVTGTLRTVALAEIEREWGWFELSPEVEVEFLKKPMLIADRIVGGNDDSALLIDLDKPKDDTASGARSNVIMDPGTVAAGTTDLVGRHVDLKNVRVLRMAADHGFFLDLQGGAVLVVPASHIPANVKPGDTVSIEGAIADSPRRIVERVNPPSEWNRHIYVVATHVKK